MWLQGVLGRGLIHRSAEAEFLVALEKSKSQYLLSAIDEEMPIRWRLAGVFDVDLWEDRRAGDPDWVQS